MHHCYRSFVRLIVGAARESPQGDTGEERGGAGGEAAWPGLPGRLAGLADEKTTGRWLLVARGGRQDGRMPSVK